MSDDKNLWSCIHGLRGRKIIKGGEERGEGEGRGREGSGGEGKEMPEMMFVDHSVPPTEVKDEQENKCRIQWNHTRSYKVIEEGHPKNMMQLKLES